jgi:hypothetical protein
MEPLPGHRLPRYLGEVISVLTDRAPDLHEALRHALEAGTAHPILDGKDFGTDGAAPRPPA